MKIDNIYFHKDFTYKTFYSKEDKGYFTTVEEIGGLISSFGHTKEESRKEERRNSFFFFLSYFFLNFIRHTSLPSRTLASSQSVRTPCGG